MTDYKFEAKDERGRFFLSRLRARDSAEARRTFAECFPRASLVKLHEASGPASVQNRWPELTIGVIGVTIAMVIIALGFVHILLGDHIEIAPKEHFTYSMTFVSTPDFLDAYNERSPRGTPLGDPIRDHLVQVLAKRLVIWRTADGWEECDDY